MKRGGKTAVNAAERFGLPVAVAQGELRLHMQGGERLVAEGHRGVLEYTQSLLRLLGKDLLVIVEGEGLVLDALCDKDACVTGRIKSVTLRTTQ